MDSFDLVTIFVSYNPHNEVVKHTVKLQKLGHPKNCCNYPKNLNSVVLLFSNVFKRCKQDGKQFMPWIWSVSTLFTQICLSEFRKNSDTRKICRNHPKIWTMWLYHWEMCPKDGEGIANSVELDQTARPGAVWSGSTLFTKTCPSENLGWPKTSDHYGT